MKMRGISQEGLKALACILMLVDHIGAVLFPHFLSLRIVGRLSFPIFCFLLTEGAMRTRKPMGYILRLLLAALISEIPFDLAFYGHIGQEGQNVMWTLLLGCAMLTAMKKVGNPGKCCLLILFAIAAECLRTDYGGYGILIIGLFELTRGVKGAGLIRAVGLTAIGAVIPSLVLTVWGISVPIQCFCALALIPIGCYNGRKRGYSPWTQWGFYSFYPVHLLALHFLR